MRTDDLTAEQRHLLVLLQQIDYGCIENLVVRNGQPMLTPLSKIVHEVKLKAGGSDRERPMPSDFTLKEQMVELLFHLADLGDGIVQRVEVQAGLPFRLVIEGSSGQVTGSTSTTDEVAP